MIKIVNVIRKVWLFVAATIPTQIPIGMTDFQKWSDSIVELSGLPDNDSVRFGLAATVLHLGPTAAFKPRLYFALVLRAGAAKQVAGQVFQDIKQRQQTQQAAAIANTAVADGPTQ